MSPYTTVCGVNDKKEGYFLLDKPLEESFRERLKAEKATYMIGCAAWRQNDYLWKRFANRGKGLCVVFVCIDSTISPHKIKYVEDLPKMQRSEFEKLSLEEQVQFALLHKRNEWENEKYFKEDEIRFLKQVNDNQEKYLMPISISSIYLGWNMPKEEINKWANLAQKNNIKVIQLTQEYIINNSNY